MVKWLNPLASIIVSIIVAWVDIQFGLNNKFILSVLVTVSLAIVFDYFPFTDKFSKKFDKEMDNIQQKYISHRNKLDELSRKDYILKEYYSVEHPYFKRVLQNKVMDLIESEDIKLLINGTYTTRPDSQDTYGINGIENTEEFGSILFFSSIHDYWEDWRNSINGKWMAKQIELLKYKNITITRIFSIEEGRYDYFKNIMKYQAGVGIDVYYIFKDKVDNQSIKKEWLSEDYLIQDEKLLVDLVPLNGDSDNHTNRKEVITIKTVDIERKLQKYLHILERSTKFEI